MWAEILAIGDELTSGQRIDTNSAWLSERLGEMGIRVKYHATAGDDLEACSRLFATALGRADVVISTGGLGPTADDLTRDALAQATRRKLQLDQDVWTHIQELFARRGRKLPERNRVQAMFPVGSDVIPNPHGTAPGIDLAVSRESREAVRCFALPGVPAEMREMWSATVRPAVVDMGAGQRVIEHRRLKCFGVGESELEQRLPDIIRRGREPSVGITVHRATITLRVTAVGESTQDCLFRMEPTILSIRESLGSLVFGEEDDQLQDVVGRQLNQAGATLATVEWGTTGILARWLRESAEASAIYRGGIVVSSQETAERLLDVKLPTHTSDSLCGAMAEAVRQRLDSDYGLAVGPIIGEDAEQERPVIHLAFATADDAQVARKTYAGHPDVLPERIAKYALDMLRLQLLNEYDPARTK